MPPFPPNPNREKRDPPAQEWAAILRNVPQIDKYMAKISGPLLDRIDIHIEVPAVPFKELSGETPGTSSAQMREQVVRAREIQRRRFHGGKTRHNAQMASREIR